MCLILFLIQSPLDLITYQRSHPPTPCKLALVSRPAKIQTLAGTQFYLYPVPSPKEWDSYLQVHSKNMFSPTEPQVALHFVHIRRWLWMFYSTQPWSEPAMLVQLQSSLCPRSQLLSPGLFGSGVSWDGFQPLMP